MIFPPCVYRYSYFIPQNKTCQPLRKKVLHGKTNWGLSGRLPCGQWHSSNAGGDGLPRRLRLLAMTVVFDSLRTKTGACGIEEYVIARSAATWQSVFPQCAALHRPKGDQKQPGKSEYVSAGTAAGGFDSRRKQFGPRDRAAGMKKKRFLCKIPVKSEHTGNIL